MTTKEILGKAAELIGSRTHIVNSNYFFKMLTTKIINNA